MWQSANAGVLMVSAANISTSQKTHCRILGDIDCISG
jgi:hypothetical protein